MPDDASAWTGREIAGYRLVKLIGRGGMGAVYKAISSAGTTVAVKLLSPEVARNATLLSRFQREAEIAIQLQHPNVVRGIEICEEAGQLIFAMEYVKGVSLLNVLMKQGRLKQKVAVRLICKVASGLRAAHRMGIVHRDVKPDNIQITHDGNAKLMDLGLVKQLDTCQHDDLTKAGIGLGTHQYMAPEQFNDARNVDVRCDVYGLAATLYVMLAGTFPFRGKGAVEILLEKAKGNIITLFRRNPLLSRRVAKAVYRGMDVSLEKRTASIDDFVEQLGIKKKPRVADVPRYYFFYFVDRSGERQLGKATRDTIEKFLQKGRMTLDMPISTNKSGPFRPAAERPEFARWRMPERVAVVHL